MPESGSREKGGFMAEKEKKAFPLYFAVLAALAAVLQLYATVRYLIRMPGDTVGIIIFAVAALLFLLLAMAGFLRWKAGRR
jgi:hypothetical protein